MDRDTQKGLAWFCGVTAVVFVLIAAWCMWTTIPAGHVGVLTSFGAVNRDVIHPGFNFVLPWKMVHKMSIQTTEVKETAEAPTREGLKVHVEVSLIYSLQPDHAAAIYDTVGLEYAEVIVKPQFRSAIRGTTVKYDAKDLYTSHRAEIEEDLEKAMRSLSEKRGITCEKVLLRNVLLPEAVAKSIEFKLTSEQESQRMQFVISKEEKEAERKRVEAKGIADSQHIIQGTLSDAYLRYLWIKSLEVAANHSGTVIYVPTGNDGLPFFKEIPAGGGKRGER